MITKRIYLSVLIFAFMNTVLFAQELREEIAIIRAEPIAPLAESYDRIGTWLENMRENVLAKEVKSRKSGSHGTLFSVLDDEGERLFITNYHVIAGADSISVEWQSSDGGNTILFENCRVLYADPFRDLAIIDVPANQDIPGSGLNIRSNGDIVKDGMEIWAAGYPGLISSPVWQLSNGIVSNQRAVISELVKDGLPYLIQHTSVIDPGSSGGPLMIREDETFTVVGVNSLSANYRHNTFYSIPSITTMQFINEYLSGASEPQREGLEDTLADFTSLLALEDEYNEDLALYISDEYSSRIGWDLYLDRRRNFKSDERDDWDRLIVGDNTLKGFKYFIAEDLRTYSDPDGLRWNITSYDPDGSDVQIISSSGKEYDTRWVFTEGQWVLDEYPSDFQIGEDEEIVKKIDDDSDKIAFMSAIAFYGGFSYALGTEGAEAPGLGGFSGGLEILAAFNKYIGTSAKLGYEKFEMNKTDYDGSSLAYSPGCIIFSSSLNIYPTQLVKGHVITPLLTAGLGLGLSFGGFSDGEGSPFVGFWSAGGGIQFAPRGKDIGRFGATLEYKGVGSIMDSDGEEASGSIIDLTLSYIIKL